MAMGFSFILMLVASNGGGELLQLADTQSYWQLQGGQPATAALIAYVSTSPADANTDKIDSLIKQLGATTFADREKATQALIKIGDAARNAVKKALEHEDPEIRIRAELVLEKLIGDDQADYIRTLMAIRTLGDLRTKDALPELEKLTQSTKPFVASYAARAIANITGEPFAAAPIEPKVLESDLMLLPKTCNVVAQFKAIGSDAMDLDSILQQGMLPPGTDATMIKAQTTKRIIEVAHRVGNLRMDAMTIGVSGKANTNEFSVVGLARGEYNADAFIATIKKESHRAEMRTEGSLRILKPDNGIAIIFIDNHSLAFVAAKDTDAAIEGIVKTLQTAKGDLAENVSLMKLVNRVDRKAHVAWAAANLDESYRVIDELKPIDTMILTINRDAKHTKMHLEIEGQDAEALAKTVESTQQQLAKVMQQMQAMAAMIPAAQKLVNALKTMKPLQEGGKVSVDFQMEGNPAGLMTMVSMLGLRG